MKDQKHWEIEFLEKIARKFSWVNEKIYAPYVYAVDKKGRYFQAYCTHRRGPQRPGDESESQLCHEKFIDKNWRLIW